MTFGATKFCHIKILQLFDVFLLFFQTFACQRSAGDIMIRNIQLRHAGKYTCAVQTKVDSVSIATDVVVRGKEDVSEIFF